MSASECWVDACHYASHGVYEDLSVFKDGVMISFSISGEDQVT